MKIAQISPINCNIDPEGSRYAVCNVVRDIANGLLEIGHEVTVFAPATSKTEALLVSTIKDQVNERDITEKQKKSGITYSLLSLQHFAEAYKNSRKFDIIHTHLGNFGQIESVFFAPLVKTPTVSTVHCPLAEIASETVKASNQNQTYVGISKNQFSKNSFFKKYPTIYHGVDIKKFIFNQKSGKYLLFMGRLYPHKGADDAIKISKELNIPLKIAGRISPSQKKYFEQKIKPLLKGSQIEFLGELHSKKIVSLYQDALALLFPIKWEEPFGLVMIEAMACGTPVIAYKKGSVPEIIKDGETGFIIKPNDINGMVKAVKQIKIINRASCREHIEKNFSLHIMVKKYENLYKQIIKEKK